MLILISFESQEFIYFYQLLKKVLNGHILEKKRDMYKKENFMYKTGHIIRTRCGKLVFELQRAELES